MKRPKKILIFQTAFLGDVILTLPLAQVLQKEFPFSEIDFLTTPRAAELVRNHPSVHRVIEYDKRKTQQGIRGILSLAKQLRSQQYDVAFVPHRSLRSAGVVLLSGIPMRIGFSTSAGRMMMSHVVHYEPQRHEVERNLSLLAPFKIVLKENELPILFPTEQDFLFVNKYLFEHEILQQHKMIALAPGSVWNTKRWLAERFAELAIHVADDGWSVVLIGGKEDEEICSAIKDAAKHKNIFNTAGKLSLMQSAEVIGRCKALVSNDSAPLHIGVAMKTPVVAIFGATVPAFGFGPYGKHDVVVEVQGLKCRPCGIHGGKTCPIGTFDCMKKIETNVVLEKVRSVNSKQ